MKKDYIHRTKGNEPVMNSIRFICSLSGEKLQLIKKQRVAMISPPGEVLPDKTQLSGSWIELRQSEGKTLYKQIIYDHLDEHVEVLTGNDDQPFTWKKTKGKEKIIVLLVPEVPGAESLVVLKTGSGEKSTPVEIARFPFK